MAYARTTYKNKVVSQSTTISRLLVVILHRDSWSRSRSEAWSRGTTVARLFVVGASEVEVEDVDSESHGRVCEIKRCLNWLPQE